MTEKVEGVVLVPEPSRERLNDHQLVGYRDHRRKLIKWALNMGKDPKHAEGYAHSTVRQRAYRLDKFARWMWKRRNHEYESVVMAHEETMVFGSASEDGNGADVWYYGVDE